MASVFWKDLAIEDVEEIVGFFAARSLGYAENLMERIMQAPRRLASLPLLGRVVPE